MPNEDAVLPGDFAAIRLCEREGCQWTVHNALVEPRDILMAMANHLQAAHPAGAGGGEGGGGMAKSTAAIPSLDEECSAIQYDAWVARLERWQAACRITDKAMENRILESIPNSVLQGGIMGFNVMGCEGRKELDQFEARKKTRKLRQFENYNKTS